MTFPRLNALCLLLAICLGGCATQQRKVPVSSETGFVTPKLEVLNQQVKANPNDAQAYSNRGYTLAILGQAAAARADLKKVIELKDNGPMRNRVGWAYFNLGDYEVAAREFQKAAEMSNGRAHYDYYSLVLGYWGTRDFKRALENYQLAVERDPRFGEFKALNDRTAEWTPLERRAIQEIYAIWSKGWRP